ncbi:MAG: FAD-dependent oxidoreductase [Desulfobacterales bacterium]|nr:FAD-dependent oxidoreductase [Desulfobacterales bacterium]
MATPQKLRCRIQKITNHGDHVYTVDLAPERPLPRFKPGQFLHLALDDYDPSGFWPESRVFSIASSPAQRNDLRISYSVKGRYTSRMENELQEGRWVWVKLPYGDFVIRDANNVALLAGGTGITAFVAFIDGLNDAFRNRVFLAYGARKPELLLYRESIDAKAGTNNGFHAFYFVETDDKNKSDKNPSQSPEFFTGCLSLEAIWNRLENPREATYYIAGPPAMIQAMTENLLKREIAPEMIKVDAWE